MPDDDRDQDQRIVRHAAASVAAIQAAALARDVLAIWTVYSHPSDFPNNYVARRCEVNGGDLQHTGDIMLGELSMIRASFLQAGLVCLPRNDDDEAHIVECWL